jgi:hypothetical protein
MTAEPRRIKVLGASHSVQGYPMFRGSVLDPAYSAIIKNIIALESIDFIFEEGSGYQTIAHGIADEGSILYLDVDPPTLEAHKFGIQDSKGQPFPEDIADEQKVEEQSKREPYWCTKIEQAQFRSGLLICGYLHTLSMAIRLFALDLQVTYADYIPHDMLCSHPKPGLPPV